MHRHTMLLAALALTTALSAPVALAQQASETTDNREIVVTGRSLKDTADALAACLARGCPPDEDVAATLAHAENQFIGGEYDGARTTLLKSLGRNRKHGQAYPVPVSDLLRANSRVALHLGEGKNFQLSVLDMRDTLKKGVGDDDPRTLVAQIEVGDSRAKLGHPEEAERIYKEVEARAIALMPAPSSDKIAVHILHAPHDKRKQIEETLTTHVPNVELVGPHQTPRFLIDVQGAVIRLLTADGLQVIGTYSFASDWTTAFALVMSRSTHVSELLALDNPSSQLKVSVRIANAPSVEPTSTRGIAVVAADVKAGQYHIRQPGTPRTALNSLQLELQVNADSYLTIVDVDSEGGINVLFPNAHHKPGFYPDGRVAGGETVLIPDSIQMGNRAGFYWDYSPPKGTDTIRVFASTDLDTARLIRERIRSLQAASSPIQRSFSTRAVSGGIGKLRDELASVAARGIVAVYDPQSHIPTEQPVPSADLTASSQEPISPDANLPVDAPVSGAPASAPSTDWSATSVTILVSD